MKFSARNLVWLVVIIAVTAIVWVAMGWKFGVPAGLIVLAISEVVERRTRASSASGVVAEHR